MKRNDLVALGLGLGVGALLLAVRKRRATLTTPPAGTTAPPAGSMPAGSAPGGAPASTADDVRVAYKRWQVAVQAGAATAEVATLEGQYAATFRAVYGKDPPVGSPPP